MKRSSGRDARGVVERVLNYLTRREYLAHYYNQRFEALDYQQSWVTVFEAFYGPSRKPAHKQPAQPCGEVEGQRRGCPNLGELARAPLRRIVLQADQHQNYRGGKASLKVTRYKLACGHRTNPRIIFPGKPEQKFARCLDCAREQRARKPSKAGVA